MHAGQVREQVLGPQSAQPPLRRRVAGPPALFSCFVGGRVGSVARGCYPRRRCASSSSKGFGSPLEENKKPPTGGGKGRTPADKRPAALEKLREYYGGAAAAFVQDDNSFGSFMQQPAAPAKHEKSSGAGQSIIGILEVCESDFSKNLAAEEQQESDAVEEYETTTQENKITKATKNQDVKYKTQEFKSLDKEITELSGDKETSNTELSAVMEYYGKIKDRCIAKPETYEERTKRRAAEIEGLKSALVTLENETAFVQRKSHGHLRRAIQ